LRMIVDTFMIIKSTYFFFRVDVNRIIDIDKVL
jgi:hypothetical protein